MYDHRYGEMLYNNVERKIRSHLSDVASRLASHQAAGEAFLREVLEEWGEHTKSMQVIRDILMVRIQY